MLNSSNGFGKQNNRESKFLKNVIVVLISNLFSVALGILVGFVVPKMMGVSEYGYYKTYTLYCSYIGVLHFGFIDGIYLKFAGSSYDDLNVYQFRTYTRFLASMELTVSLIILFFAFFLLDTYYFLIFVFVSLNVFATNLLSYYEFISQATMRFKRMTARNIIRCLLNILAVLFLYILYKYESIAILNHYYVGTVLAINYVLVIWYSITYRDITFGRRKRFTEEKNNIIGFFKTGIILLLSNLVVQLVFVVDQQFVNIAFDVNTYSVYAFAYNMISLITIASSAISVVLYPTLRTISQESITRNYSKINSMLLMFIALCLVAYYPLVFVVNRYLQGYVSSLSTFMIILPGILISSSISVIKYNCYKTFGIINKYFVKSIAVLAIAIIADLCVYFIFKDTKSISIVSIIVLLVWYLLVEMYFVNKYRVKWIKNFTYILVIIFIFYISSSFFSLFAGAMFYLFLYLIATFLFYFDEIKELTRRVKGRKSVV